MIKTLAETWYRLVFRCEEDPRLKLLAGAAGLVYSQAVVEQLQRKAAECGGCVDRLFTVRWLQRLTHESQATRAQAHNALRMLLGTLPFISSRAERTHLVAQELKTKKRGRAPHSSTVSKTTYYKGVVACSKRAQQAAYASHFTEPKYARRWKQVLASFRIGAHARRKGRRRKRTGDAFEFAGGSLPENKIRITAHA